MIVLDPLTITIIGSLISSGIGGLLWWFKKRNDARKKHLTEISDIRKAVWRLTKTLIILAKLIDKTSRKAHPEIESELEEIARELLNTTNSYEEEA